MSGATKRKKRRESLWKKQSGLCHWCERQMVHWNDRDRDPGKRTKEMQKLWATIDHLRPRHHPFRCDGNPRQEQRWVLACWKCNNDRDREAVMKIPIEERWLAARAFPQDVPAPYFIRPAVRN